MQFSMSPGLSNHLKNCPRRDETHTPHPHSPHLTPHPHLPSSPSPSPLPLLLSPHPPHRRHRRRRRGQQGPEQGRGELPGQRQQELHICQFNVLDSLAQSSPVEEGLLTSSGGGGGLGCLRSGQHLKIQYTSLSISVERILDITYQNQEGAAAWHWQVEALRSISSR